MTTSSFSWTRTSNNRPALEVERGLLRDARLPQSPNPVSTLRTQSAGIRALSIETSEGQDKIRGLSATRGVTTPYDITSVEEVDTRFGWFTLDSEMCGLRR